MGPIYLDLDEAVLGSVTQGWPRLVITRTCYSVCRGAL